LKLRFQNAIIVLRNDVIPSEYANMISRIKKTALIIEDEPIFRLNYKIVLEKHGWQVIEAHTGAKGLEMVQSTKPDIVLLDLILPEMNGYEVLKRIRILFSKLPVIVFSVMSTETDMNRAYQLGADHYIIKGLESPMAILHKIDSLIFK
jgi:DNA-binding response OmpR family regulator